MAGADVAGADVAGVVVLFQCERSTLGSSSYLFRASVSNFLSAGTNHLFCKQHLMVVHEDSTPRNGR